MTVFDSGWRLNGRPLMIVGDDEGWILAGDDTVGWFGECERFATWEQVLENLPGAVLPRWLPGEP